MMHAAPPLVLSLFFSQQVLITWTVKISMLKKIDRSCRYDWLATKSLRAGYFPWAMLAYGLGMEY
jgi:hypothetical protein